MAEKIRQGWEYIQLPEREECRCLCREVTPPYCGEGTSRALSYIIREVGPSGIIGAVVGREVIPICTRCKEQHAAYRPGRFCSHPD